MSCSHKTWRHFVTGCDEKGRKLWRCSTCGESKPWDDGTTYHGSVECRDCGTASIDHVMCAACKKASKPARRKAAAP